MIAVFEVMVVGIHVEGRFRNISAGGDGSTGCGRVVVTRGKLTSPWIKVGMGCAGREVEHEVLRYHLHLVVRVHDHMTRIPVQRANRSISRQNREYQRFTQL